MDEIKILNENIETESSSTSNLKKLVNAQTQHGSEATAEEENIVLLATSYSPVREESDEVVWHEDFEDVSLKLFFLNISNIQLFLMSKLLQHKLFDSNFEKPDFRTCMNEKKYS